MEPAHSPPTVLVADMAPGPEPGRDDSIGGTRDAFDVMHQLEGGLQAGSRRDDQAEETPIEATEPPLAIVRASKPAFARGAFRAGQFRRDGNWLAHYETTGPEFWDQSGGWIDAFVDFLGSGGTYAGVTRALKERNPAISCYVVEPEGAATAAGKPVTRPDHPIQGGGYAMDLDFLKGVPVDGFLEVTGNEARGAARALARLESIFGGFSSGANVAAALKLLSGEMEGRTVGVMVCDSGLKYLSTDLWD